MHSAGLLLGTPSCTRLEASLRASPPHLPNHKYTHTSSKSNSFDHFQLLIINYPSQLSSVPPGSAGVSPAV